MAPSNATLLLRRSRIAALASTRDYLSCMRDAFIALAANQYSTPAVAPIDGVGGTIHAKSALRAGASPRLAFKVNANYPRNILVGMPTIQGFIALLDAQNGRLLALMDSIEITARRTAAATALAAMHLARRDARVLGIVGCGAQARYHLEALLEVFRIEEVRYCEPRVEAAETFAATVQAFAVRAVRTSEPGSAADADIVVTLTPSTQPLLTLADVRPGAFVAGVGADNAMKNELAADLLQASRVVVDSLRQAATMGDLHHAIKTSAMSLASVHGELAAVVSDAVPGRTNDAERFVFDSTGTALQDLAAAEMVYERAYLDQDVEAIVLNDALIG